MSPPTRLEQSTCHHMKPQFLQEKRAMTSGRRTRLGRANQRCTDEAQSKLKWAQPWQIPIDFPSGREKSKALSVLHRFADRLGGSRASLCGVKVFVAYAWSRRNSPI